MTRHRSWGVSSRKPEDIPVFNGGMIQLFAEHQQKAAARIVRLKEQARTGLQYLRRE